mmetsp:Transcript_17049/g.25811  ORF Transcript_17049/g.25811 Transcript_17049/m.25811 type:complete len:112 (+) Transcript_17049:118-453(+)
MNQQLANLLKNAPNKLFGCLICSMTHDFVTRRLYNDYFRDQNLGVVSFGEKGIKSNTNSQTNTSPDYPSFCAPYSLIGENVSDAILVEDPNKQSKETLMRIGSSLSLLFTH